MLPAWKSTKGCPFFLVNEKVGGIAQFCGGSSACQLVSSNAICDGSYDCFDRQVGKAIKLIWIQSNFHFHLGQIATLYPVSRVYMLLLGQMR